jgi:hypothetical protein
MAKMGPPTGQVESTKVEAGRAEWTRPALQRLRVSGAETHQKESMDGVLGKGS